MGNDAASKNKFCDHIKEAFNKAEPLNSNQKAFVLSLVDGTDVKMEESPAMHIETATMPTGFTNVTTTRSYAIVCLKEGDMYFRCSNSYATSFWVVVHSKVPGVYDNIEDSLAQVLGVSKQHQQGGFNTMAEADAYMVACIKDLKAWGIMICLLGLV
ncbi:hypothetical protein ARMGADRAFT_1089842 [Armillaria gallica]|uniref:Ribonuclease H1 N-terminal domain-containing protein n=1 Tax=Armillaria gallica TaxID=47427 RepID=A0A2H3CM41_ARMGA|nr:hypothetical protein ARMGADRAFT_1089842 [Armillaria gallica]